jgi:predicted secreted protein
MPFSTPMTIAILVTIWFTVLFAVLPFGVRSQHEEGPYIEGTDPGAPVAPKLWMKALWTTLLTFVVFGLLVVAVRVFGAGRVI